MAVSGCNVSKADGPEHQCGLVTLVFKSPLTPDICERASVSDGIIKREECSDFHLNSEFSSLLETKI